MDVITHLYLQIKSNPALWLVLTLSSYIFGQWLFRVAKFNPLFSPIIVAVVTTMCVLLLCGVPYEQYFAGAQFIHFLLGPATVALAVPIYEQRLRLAKLWLPLSIGIVVGCATAIVSVIILGWAFGLSSQTLISLIPKSVMTKMAELQEILNGKRPGDKMSITYLRNKKASTKTITLKNAQGNTSVIKSADLDVLGGSFRPITESQKNQLNIKYGVEVMKVNSGALKDGGILRGFIIQRINDNNITSLDDLQKAVKSASTSKDPVLYIQGIWPTGKKAYFAVPLQKD